MEREFSRLKPFLLSSSNLVNPERILGPSFFLSLPSSPLYLLNKVPGKICPYSCTLMSALPPESVLTFPEPQVLSCLPQKGANNAAAIEGETPERTIIWDLEYEYDRL